MNIVWKPCFVEKIQRKLLDMTNSCEESSQKLVAEVHILYFWGGTREIHRITLDKTHDENVASIGSHNTGKEKRKLKTLCFFLT